MRVRLLVMGLVGAMATAFVLRSPPVDAGGGFDRGSCTFKGKRLYGKLMMVNAFPDTKIQLVTAFPDVKVQYVDAFAGVP